MIYSDISHFLFSEILWTQNVKTVAVVIIWWTASYLTNVTSMETMDNGKESTSHRYVDRSVIFLQLGWFDLTALQLLSGAVMSVVLARWYAKRNVNFESPDRGTIITAVIGHLLGTLATNVSLFVIGSGLALHTKALQPLFTIAVQCVYFGKQSPSIMILLSVIVLSSGACAFAIPAVTLDIWSIGSVVISSTAFSFRNSIVRSSPPWDDPLYNYTILSTYGSMLLIPFIFLRVVLTQNIPKIYQLSSCVMSFCDLIYNVVSLTVLATLGPLSHSILELSERLFWKLGNIIDEDAQHFAYAAVSMFLILNFIYIRKCTRRLTLRKTVVVLCISICIVIIIWSATGTHSSRNTRTAQASSRNTRTAQALNQKPEREIITSWIYDKPIPTEVVQNINSIQKKYPNFQLEVFCGTSQCVEAIKALRNPSINVVFLMIGDVMQDTPLERWFARHPLHKVIAGADFEDHLQGAVQLALLWHVGGIYMDPTLVINTVVFPSVPCVVGETNETTNHGPLDISYFTAHNPFVHELATNFTSSYPIPKDENNDWSINFDYRAMQWDMYRAWHNNNNGNSTSESIATKLNKVKYSRDNRHHYGGINVNEYENQGVNPADLIQSYSGIQFLPFIDTVHKRGNLSAYENDHTIADLCNMPWVDSDMDWPSIENILPVLTRINDNISRKTTAATSIDDQMDKELIGSKGSEAPDNARSHFSGCLKFMLQNPTRGMLRTDSVYLVDVHDDVKRLLPQAIVAESIKLQHFRKGITLHNYISRFVESFKLIEMYSTARLVITQNPHAVLASVAMGTPVVFINEPKVSTGGTTYVSESSHFGGLAPYSHILDMQTQSKDDIHEWVQHFNWRFPPVNPGLGRLMRLKATLWNVMRTNQRLYDSARKFSLLPLTSIPDSMGELTFHFIFTTTETNRLSQFYTNNNATVSGAFNWVHMRAIESVFYHHPFATVLIHSNTLQQQRFNVLTESGYKIEVQRYNISNLIARSPARLFTDSRLSEAMHGPYWYSHETDFLRMLILYTYGGVYMDTDMVLVKPVEKLDQNIPCLPGLEKEKLKRSIYEI